MSDASDLLNLIQREAERVVKKHMPGHRFGIVKQYNPAGPAVVLEWGDDLDASGNPTLSPWMPIILPSGGANSGDIAAPTLGSQAVALHFGYGADRFTFMLGTVRPAQEPPPGMPTTTPGTPPPGVPETDRAIVHQAGQGLYLRSDGAVLAGMGDGTFLRLATEDFVLNIYDHHTHKVPNVSTGSSTVETNPPDQQVLTGDTTNLTANLKGT